MSPDPRSSQPSSPDLVPAGLSSLSVPLLAAAGRRVAQQPVVLGAPDTTNLNYSAHPATGDLGPIGSQPEGPLGLLVDNTMAFSVEARR